MSSARRAESEPLLVAEDLEKEYRSGPEVVRVLRGASLVIRPAEVVALVGASGVGKSTLLHLLGALDRPTAGRVLFAGQELFDRGEAELVRYRRQEVGFVFQFYNLLGELSALENAMIPALIARRPGREARALAAAALAELEATAAGDGRDEESAERERRVRAVLAAFTRDRKLLAAAERLVCARLGVAAAIPRHGACCSWLPGRRGE